MAGKLGLAAASLLVGLFLAEAVLRVAAPGYSPLFLDLYRIDEGVLGLRPGIERRHVSSEWEVEIAINAEGLRDRETPAAAGGGTLLGLGDSFAFGWGVELEESFLYRTEEALAGEEIRVVKAGMPATGTSDQLAWLRRHGGRYRPDVVLVAFFVGNDFVDVGRGGVPAQFTVEAGLMSRLPAGEAEGPPRRGVVRGPLRRLKRSSLLAQRAAQLLWAVERRLLEPRERPNPGLRTRDAWLEEFAQIHLRRPPPATERAVELTLAALDGIVEWCAANGCQPLVMVIPRSFQVYDWELERWQRAFGLEDGALDLDRPQRLLASWAERRGVALLDLLPAFRAHRRESPDERLYFYPDAHLRPAGHRLAAEELVRFVRRRGMLPERVENAGV